MEAMAHVGFSFESLTDPETGQWCERCLLPSAVRADVALTAVGSAPDHPDNIGYAIFTALWCGCGWMRREQTTSTRDVGPSMTDDPRG